MQLNFKRGSFFAIALLAISMTLPIRAAAAEEQQFAAWVEKFDGDWQIENAGHKQPLQLGPIYCGSHLRIGPNAKAKQSILLSPSTKRFKTDKIVIEFRNKQLYRNNVTALGEEIFFKVPEQKNNWDVLFPWLPKPESPVVIVVNSSADRGGEFSLNDGILAISGNKLDLTPCIKMNKFSEFHLEFHRILLSTQPHRTVSDWTIEETPAMSDDVSFGARDTTVLESDIKPGLYELVASVSEHPIDKCIVLVVPSALLPKASERLRATKQELSDWSSQISDDWKRRFLLAQLALIDAAMIQKHDAPEARKGGQK